MMQQIEFITIVAELGVWFPDSHRLLLSSQLLKVFFLEAFAGVLMKAGKVEVYSLFF